MLVLRSPVDIMRRVYRLKPQSEPEKPSPMRLPSANPLAGTRALGARCRQQLWARLVSLVVQAVNQRGLCAVEMTILAELPSEEVELMRKQCSCPSCFAQRAN